MQSGFVARFRELMASTCVAPLLLGAVTVSACAKSCDAFAAAGLTVDVVDASGTLVCDAEVVATDGSEEFVLEASPECSYTGAWERSGTYVVHASLNGRTVESEAVHVGSDECHVKPQRVELTLPT